MKPKYTLVASIARSLYVDITRDASVGMNGMYAERFMRAADGYGKEIGFIGCRCAFVL